MNHDCNDPGQDLESMSKSGAVSRLLTVRAQEDREAAMRAQPAAVAEPPALAARLVASLSAVTERLMIIVRAATPAGGRERNHIRLWLRLRLNVPVEANRYVSVTKKPGPDYASWLTRYDSLSRSDRQAIELHIEQGGLAPVAVVAIFETSDSGAVERLITQLKSQMLRDWHAIICAPALRQSAFASSGDSRVVFINDRRDKAAWAAELRGYRQVVLVGDDITLRDHTLYAFAASASANAGARLIYADHDQLNADGSRESPHFKPRFSPERHRRTVFLGSCAMLNDSGGFGPLIAQLASGETVAAIIDSTATALPRAVVQHVPEILYHQNLPRFTPRPHEEPVLPDGELPSVAIIIPTKDRLDLLKVCIDSIEQRSDWPRDRYQIVVVDNNSQEAATLRYMASARNLLVLRDRQEFNYSRINNLAVAAVSADLLVFLNNDTEIIRPDWLRRLAAFAVQPDVGAVGPKLLFSNNSVQHAGVVVGFRGVAAHGLIGIAEDDGGYGNLANLTREVSAVTGACLAMRASVFHEIGGFNEALAVTLNDVALCLEAQARGYRNIYLAEPQIVHHESQSRGYDETEETISRNVKAACHTRAKFLSVFKDDPYYSPNLSIDELYELAEPPRAERPWLSFARSLGLPLRVLLLSDTHDAGNDGAVVLALQANALVQAGFTIFVGGSRSDNELPYAGCHRIHLDSAQQAADFAWQYAIDCVVLHSMPFLTIVRILGEWPRSIIYDRDPDAVRDRAIRPVDAHERRYCAALADRVYSGVPTSELTVQLDRQDVVVLPEPVEGVQAAVDAPGENVPEAWKDVLSHFVDSVRELCGR